MKNPEELESFMLKHGENVIDTLGAEVDRLEKELKVKPLIIVNKIHRYASFYYFRMLLLDLFCTSKTDLEVTVFCSPPQQRNPEVRHVDLEIL